MIMFKLNNKDYSSHVVAEGYNVAQNAIYKTWNDAFGIEHRSVTRKCVQGSFAMIFATDTEYNTFLSDIATSKQTDGTNRIVVAINKPSNTNKTIDAFIEFEATRKRNAMWADVFDSFKVKIKEK